MANVSVNSSTRSTSSLLEPTPLVAPDELEEARAERRDDLARYVRDHQAEGDLQRFASTITVWDPHHGARVRPWRESVFGRNQPGQPEELRSINVPFDADEIKAKVDAEHPLVKRAPLERAEALTNRLVTTARDYPELLEATLAEIGVEYWKAGMPVNREDLQRVAGEFLTKANNQQQTEYRDKPVGWSR